MTHPSESHLNAYFDSALDDPTRLTLQAHLETCPACRGRLEQLQQLSLGLDLLAERDLPHDLVGAVLERLPRRRPVWGFVLAGEAGLGLGIAAWLASSPDLDLLSWLRAGFTPAALLDPLQGGWLALQAGLARAVEDLPSLLPIARQLAFRPQAAFWLLLIPVTLAFLAGNLRLLRSNGKSAGK